MKKYVFGVLCSLGVMSAAFAPEPALAHKLRETGKSYDVAKSNMNVTVQREWNALDWRIGKNTETWTLDGEQLNDVTFYGGIKPGSPLMKEGDKKNNPLPKFTKETLLVEIPELLEGTYRTARNVGKFEILSTEPHKFLGNDGVLFTYEYIDSDELTRKGEARAAIIKGNLYMISFDAPRLHYYDSVIQDFRALASSAFYK